jgi:2-furoyl-CoA dehydrogenase 2Fe-2S iron sulfur subunit
MPLIAKRERTLVKFQLNGKPAEGYAESNTLLSDFLRGEIGATGTHVGCEHGVCGACTIRVDGRATRSCLYLAVQIAGRNIQTIEGVSEADGIFGKLQQAFHENFALQCGFCTPGFLMSIAEFLEENPDPSEAEVRDALSGNMCRCTGYAEIVRATLQAAKTLRGPSSTA